MSGTEKIGEMLSSHIPKDFLLSVDARFHAALDQATAQGQSFAPGHRSNVTGVCRHFKLNEALDDAFTEFDITHRPLRGNAIVAGDFGPVAIARFHKNKGPWNNSRRSAGKLGLCRKNNVAEYLVQPDFLREENAALTELTCFLVTEHDGRPDESGEIYLVVPDTDMDLKNLLFQESLTQFMQRYQKVQALADRAVPTLKPGVKRQQPREDRS
ncbi:MAG: hypothetical protein A3E01_18790 [Gammaproteobacteria bacterium RIFCSPHIGHO2_12_FULL_63_22]|nr:MAG: hypothetical protein A3E01_18790 [Gammaproteobacteria bacterium RIFCSPHIGHO2_12_FULL_63_22]